MSEDKAKKPEDQKVDPKNSVKGEQDKLVPLTDEHLEKVVGGHPPPVINNHKTGC